MKMGDVKQLHKNHRNEETNFTIEEIQMALGQKDLEIVLYQKQIRKLNEEIKKLKDAIANGKD